MYFDNVPFSEPIETVNAECVGVYRTERAAAAAARSYFSSLGLEDSHGEDDEEDEDDLDEFYWDATENGADCHTFNERVFVVREELK